MTVRRRSRPGAGTRAGLLALAGYVLVFGWLARSWILAAPDSVAVPVVTARSDQFLIVWILWWVARSLFHHPAEILNAPINYPEPGQLTGSEHFATSQLIFAPAYWLSDNPVLSANLTAIVSYPLSAFAMNRLLVALGFTGLRAWVAGLVPALGPLQVPGHLHVIQCSPLFFALVALALVRLRAHPRPARCGALALCLVAGFLSSFYVAAMLVAFVVLWAVVEGRGATSTRWRFVGMTVAALAVATVVLAGVSLPYLSRGEVGEPFPFRTVGAVVIEQLGSNARALFGRGMHAPGPLLWAFAFAGIVGWLEKDLRRYVLGAWAVIACALFLCLGGLQMLAALPDDPPTVVKIAARFFRIFPRGAVLFGIGAGMLAAMLFEVGRRRLPPWMATALVVAAAVALLSTRGAMLGVSIKAPVTAYREHHRAYEAIGRTMAARGGGALLELPLAGRRVQPGYRFVRDVDAMLAATVHGAPLVTGHSGYQPKRRAGVNTAIAGLPRPNAVRNLRRLTGLRWIVVGPAGYWPAAETREHFVTQLVTESGMQRRLAIDGFDLLELPDDAPAARVSGGPNPPWTGRGTAEASVTVARVGGRP